MVPADSATSAPKVKAMPTGPSMPAPSRLCSTMPTPATPSASPASFVRVSRSPSSGAASTAVSTGFMLMISAAKPEVTLCTPK